MMAFAVHTEGISVWTVFFMRILLRRIGICALLAAMVWLGALLADREMVCRELFRIHRAADFDLSAAQEMDFRIQDTVVDFVKEKLREITDVDQAKAYLREKLPQIQNVVYQTLLEETEIRFALLDAVGRLENIFFGG